jgi:phthiocerol/phenolphthiocerol synthesis type-I polyketide synthase A
MACRSLHQGESDLALAGGCMVVLDPWVNASTSAIGMLSATGRCQSFDVKANGFVRSEGSAMVLLKRLPDAVRDGDRILAVIRGTASNQDGRSETITSPSMDAQVAVYRSALEAAGVDAASIGMIEAHGTGTPVGDPTEFKSLAQVYGTDGPCALASVKSNLGHTESAAGTVGLIKAVLALQHGTVPRMLHFTQLPEDLTRIDTNLFVPQEITSWPGNDGHPRRAAVSSYGMSGTNAHAILEQAPTPATSAETTGHNGVAIDSPMTAPLLFPVSSTSVEALRRTSGRLADWAERNTHDVALRDAAYTLARRRAHGPVRTAVLAADLPELATALREVAEGDLPYQPAVGNDDRGPVWVFSGQGSQWAGMGKQLMADEPAFAVAVDELEPLFVEQMRFSLQQVLTEGQRVAGDARVQPVLMGLQLALTALWRSYGVEPDAVIGHSMGEVTAAVVAGALTPAEGLRVIGTRSRLMSRLAGQGAVALLEMDAEAVEKLLADYPEVSLAGYLSPRQTLVAGSVAQVDAVIVAASAQERFARRVNMEVASHTALMDPILPELRSALADLTPKAPTIPFISTVADAAGTPTLDAQYWVANVRQPVRLHQAITTAAEQHATFIEISPHPTLTQAVTETLESVHHHSIGTLSRKGDDTVSFHSNLNSTYVVRPPKLAHPPEPHPVLPSAPWHHTKHWISAENFVKAAESAPRPGTLLGQHIPVGVTPPTHLWQARLAPNTKPYPGSHQNNGVEIIPISVLLQTLSAASAECGASIFSDIKFEYPIVVDEPRVIQVVADDESVTVSSSGAVLPSGGPGQHWVRHVTARITRKLDDHEAEGLPDAAVAGPGATDTEFADESVTSLWQTWGSQGRPFGWSIGSCQSTAGVLHADVELSQASSVALLDAAIHTGRLLDSANPRLMVPASVESVRFEAELADPRGRVEVRRRGGNDQELIVDIAVTAPDGSTCIDVRALRYAAVDSSAVAGRNDDPATMVHAIDWQPFSPDEGHDDSHHLPDGPSTVAVLGDDKAVGTLRGELADAGYPSAAVAEARCVLYVAQSRVDEADADCAVRLSMELADLVRGLAQRDDDHPVRLWIITRGVREGSSDAALAQSPLWGTAGVIRAEQPQLWGGLVDLPDGSDIGDHVPALSTILRTPTKSILALRDGEFLAPALVPVAGEPVREPLRCRPDAAYLITGGMGALGLLMAGWLADHGARRLVLAGRTALPPRRDWDSDANDPDTRQKINAIRSLEMRGVAVEAVSLDIGSLEAMQALLAKRDAEGAVPIRGVIHGAGITDAELFTELDESRLRRTIWPKVAGAQVLHRRAASISCS